jgi:hypothetical protein
MIRGIPDHVIPIPSLHPGFPFSANDSVHFPGKQGGGPQKLDNVISSESEQKERI